MQQSHDAADRLAQVQATLRLDHRNSRAVVASVFQAAETFNHYGPGLPVSNVADYSAMGG